MGIDMSPPGKPMGKPVMKSFLSRHVLYVRYFNGLVTNGFLLEKLVEGCQNRVYLLLRVNSGGTEPRYGGY